jgi:hypothetical protein
LRHDPSSDVGQTARQIVQPVARHIHLSGKPVDRTGNGRHTFTEHIAIEIDPDQRTRQCKGQEKTNPGAPAPS